MPDVQDIGLRTPVSRDFNGTKLVIQRALGSIPVPNIGSNKKNRLVLWQLKMELEISPHVPVLNIYKMWAYFIKGVSSRPLSNKDLLSLWKRCEWRVEKFGKHAL